MTLTLNRLALDGSNSPLGLVTKIFQAEPSLGLRIPIESLCENLDIIDIRELDTDGFLGGLLTTPARTNGIILVQRGLSETRRRFTIAHELGHFLITTHRPASEGQFLCDKEAFRSWNVKDQRAALKMEAEANRFAAALLMPPHQIRKVIDGARYASLLQVLEIADRCGVSKEAASRCFVDYCSETTAILIVKNGGLVRSYRSRDFPRLAIGNGERVPAISSSWANLDVGQTSDLGQTLGEHWLDVEFGETAPKTLEQVHFQANGYATILLKVLRSFEDDRDEFEDLTAKERLARRRDRWQR